MGRRRCDSRSRSVCAAALLVALAGCGDAVGTPRGSSYAVLQMNLCLSGLAGCYEPAGVEEAEARIRGAHPDAVTLSEACRGDVARIARRTGYRLRFSAVTYRGKRLQCVRPGGRGLFGDAVLTEAAAADSDSREFASQAGIERRRWL